MTPCDAKWPFWCGGNCKLHELSFTSRAMVVNGAWGRGCLTVRQHYITFRRLDPSVGNGKAV